MPRSRSRSRLLLGAFALVGAAVLTTTAPVAAGERPGMAIARGSESVKSYEGISGQYPATFVRLPDPEQCRVVNYCDVIPLDIAVPTDVAPGDDYFVLIETTWEPFDIGDLDIYLYDDGQIKAAKGDTPAGESPYTLLAQDYEGAPAKVKKSEPDLGRYNLVVLNKSGPNTAYTVKGSIGVAPFERPFESLEPPPAAPTDDFDEGEPPAESLPPDFSDPATVDELGDPVEPVLPDVVPNRDPELDGLLGRRTGAGGPQQSTSGAIPIGAERPPGPVSAMAVLFWLAVVPGALLGGLAFWLLRRRKAAFGFA